MARKKIDVEAFEALGELLDPPPPPTPVKDATWSPELNPIQQQIFDCEVRNVLAWGEKGSGKSVAMIHRMVRHVFDNENALGIILTPIRSMSQDGGAWHKLLNDILPQWERGLGLQWKRGNDKQQNELVWVQNRFGAWSMIKETSAPHPEQLRERFPGREPSCVFVDELTFTNSQEYFTAISAQLGRRPKVTGVQQYLAACNPAGPTHWVFETWFVRAYDEEKGDWNPNFKQIHVPLSDNAKNLPPDYIPNLKDTYRHDSIESARLLDGQWVDRPSGESIFLGLYNPIVHVKPLDERMHPSTTQRLCAHKDYPIIIGWDPGQSFGAWVFLQSLPIDGRRKWVVIDEISILRKKIFYPAQAPLVQRRVRFWRDTAGAEVPIVIISDEAAHNVFRSATGSYDALDMERAWEASRRLYNLEPIKIRAAPKDGGSVRARIETVQKLLADEDIIVSSGCVNINKMFLGLESERQKSGAPFDPKLAFTPRRSDHIHLWDALSYPIFTASVQPSRIVPAKQGGTSTLISVHAAA